MAEVRELRDVLRRRKRMRIWRRILALTVLAALAAAVIFVLLNRDRFTPEAVREFFSTSFENRTGQEGFPVQLSSGTATSLSAAGSNLCVTSQTGLSFYSPRGRLLRTVAHAHKNVQTKAAGENVLLYAVGGDEASVETASKTSVTLKLDNAVVTGDICKNGRFALVCESDVYNSQLLVYDKSGNAVFRWTPSGSVITAVALSPDGYSVAAATISTQGGQIRTGIHLFSTRKSDAVFSQVLENELVLKMSCTKNSVQVIGDTALYRISGEGEVARYDYAGRTLHRFADCSAGQALVLRDANDPGKSVLTVLNDECRERSSVTVDQAIIDVAGSGDQVFLLSDTQLLCYDAATARRESFCNIDNDAEYVAVTSAAPYVVTAAAELIRCTLSK